MDHCHIHAYILYNFATLDNFATLANFEPDPPSVALSPSHVDHFASSTAPTFGIVDL